MGTASLVISNEEMKYIMKIGESLEEFSLSIKGAYVTIENEQKEQKGLFLGMFSVTSNPGLLRKMQVVKLPELMKEQVELGKICTAA